VLLDPYTLDPSGLTTITWLAPDPTGRLVAYGTYSAGDENTSLHLVEVDTGTKLPQVIPNKVNAPMWLPDGSGFVYRNLGDPANPYSGQVMHHRLGTAVSDDVQLYRQLTPQEDALLATTWGPAAKLSHDGRWLVLTYSTVARSNDVWLMDFDAFRRDGSLERREVSRGTAGTATGTVKGDTLYLFTYKGAPNGRVVAVDTAAPGEDNWRDLIPERSDAAIDDVTFTAGHIVVNYLRASSNTLEVFDLEGRSSGTVPLPTIGTVGTTDGEGSDVSFFEFTSFNHPPTIFSFDAAHPSAEPVPWARVDSPIDADSVVVSQAWYDSADGTRVSMFLVHRRDLVLDGTNPTILAGYGGFGVSETPQFNALLYPWFEDGGIYALPNLRGGGEYGDAWHEAGMLGNKQNVFDDFAAAARWLIDNGYTSPARLAALGRSNGGLLTGAALTQWPELFRAVIVGVPLLDMLRFQHFLMARYWVPEYGSAEDPQQFEWLQAYSPYQRVVPGTEYPAVFLTAGENDARVHPVHARKMTAALQAATASDPAERPVLLWVDREAGHGQGKPLNLVLRDAVDTRLFLMWQLGMLEGSSTR
jgi:prolyl oligopeptidase